VKSAGQLAVRLVLPVPKGPVEYLQLIGTQALRKQNSRVALAPWV
jgi:hypothetical protein